MLPFPLISVLRFYGFAYGSFVNHHLRITFLWPLPPNFRLPPPPPTWSGYGQIPMMPIGSPTAKRERVLFIHSLQITNQNSCSFMGGKRREKIMRFRFSISFQRWKNIGLYVPCYTVYGGEFNAFQIERSVDRKRGRIEYRTYIPTTMHFFFFKRIIFWWTLTYKPRDIILNGKLVDLFIIIFFHWARVVVHIFITIKSRLLIIVFDLCAQQRNNYSDSTEWYIDIKQIISVDEIVDNAQRNI